jgi:hypothetical protein
MSERLKPEQGDEQPNASGLLLSVEPMDQNAHKLYAKPDSDDGRDGTTDSDGSDAKDKDRADRADGDGTDGSDGDGTDGADTDGKDGDGSDGADVSTDADGTDA